MTKSTKPIPFVAHVWDANSGKVTKRKSYQTEQGAMKFALKTSAERGVREVVILHADDRTVVRGGALVQSEGKATKGDPAASTATKQGRPAKLDPIPPAHSKGKAAPAEPDPKGYRDTYRRYCTGDLKRMEWFGRFGITAQEAASIREEVKSKVGGPRKPKATAEQTRNRRRPAAASTRKATTLKVAAPPVARTRTVLDLPTDTIGRAIAQAFAGPASGGDELADAMLSALVEREHTTGLAVEKALRDHDLAMRARQSVQHAIEAARTDATVAS